MYRAEAASLCETVQLKYWPEDCLVNEYLYSPFLESLSKNLQLNKNNVWHWLSFLSGAPLLCVLKSQVVAVRLQMCWAEAELVLVKVLWIWWR